jgi:hypothetical protein
LIKLYEHICQWFAACFEDLAQLLAKPAKIFFGIFCGTDQQLFAPCFQSLAWLFAKTFDIADCLFLKLHLLFLIGGLKMGRAHDSRNIDESFSV